MWIARRLAVDGTYVTESIGVADDTTDRDGHKVLSYADAVDKAREWRLAALHCPTSESFPTEYYTIDQALDDYVAHLTTKGSRGLKGTEGKINATIRPALGRERVAKLTAKRIADFQAALANSPRLGRTGKPIERQSGNLDEHSIRRARRATANRTVSVLKAALNLAYREGRATSDDAWRRVRPFPNTSAPRVRYLQRHQIAALDDALMENFRPLYRAAIFTGGRYRELTELRVADVDLTARTVLFRITKNGKPRFVPLVDDAIGHFRNAIEGRKPTDLVFTRSPGRAWRTAEQARPLLRGCENAGIVPAVSFHDLRHTFAAMLAQQGVPMRVIAEALGHSDTRITEKHYAHLTPSYVASALRAHFPEIAFTAKIKTDAHPLTRLRPDAHKEAMTSLQQHGEY